MKKSGLFIMILAISIFFSSCMSLKDSNSKKIAVKEEGTSVYYDELKKLPKEYSSEIAKKSGDVVDIHGNCYNMDKLEKFIAGYENSIRITSYTIEGDAIINYLIRNSDEYILIEDITRDKFSGETKKIKEYAVVDIIKQNMSDGKVYVAKLRDNENISLLHINK